MRKKAGGSAKWVRKPPHVGLFRRGAVWYARTWDPVGKRKVKRSLGTPDWPTAKARAQEWALQLEAGEPPTRGAVPLGPLIDRFLRHQKTAVSPGWLANQRHHLAEFLARCPFVDAAKIRPAQVQAFLAGIGGAPATANRYRATLSRFFGWAITSDLLGHNPVVRVRQRREEKRLPEFLSREQMGQVRVSFAGSKLEIPVLLSLYAGLRRGEVCALRWEDVDLDAGRLSIRHARGPDGKLYPTKARKQRSIPIHEHLARALRAAQDRSLAAVWVSIRSRRPWRPDQLSRALTRHAAKAGLPWLDGLHVLRRTFASQLAIAGVPLGTIAALLGDTISVTERYYVHLVPSRQEVLDVF